MSKIFEDFIKSDIYNFPIDECILELEGVSEILYSNKLFLCLIIDSNNHYNIEFKLMNPYIANINDRDKFGWTQNINDELNFVDNYYNPIHEFTNKFVIAFQKNNNYDKYKKYLNEFYEKDQ